MLRFALCIAIVAIASLAPPASALGATHSTCPPPDLPPPDARNDTLDTCAQVTLYTPAGASHTKTNATARQVASQYNVSFGSDVLIVLGGNPGPVTSSQNQTFSLPLRQ